MEAHNPPGQKYIPNFVIYTVLGRPKIDIQKYKLIIEGLVENKLSFTYEDLNNLPTIRITRDFHCVTGWSVKDVTWEGIPLKLFADRSKISEDVRWVYFVSIDGYTSVVSIKDFLTPDSILALKMNGSVLPLEHGYPARIIIPHLYGWKGAKWVYRIIFMDKYKDGYWEALGYNERGRVSREERFKGL